MTRTVIEAMRDALDAAENSKFSERHAATTRYFMGDERLENALAEALHEYADGEEPFITLMCWHMDTDLKVTDTAPHRTCRKIAKQLLDNAWWK